MISLIKFSKGFNFVHKVGGVTVLCLIMLYICTRFCKNILNGDRVMSGYDFTTTISKGAIFRQKCRWSFGTLHIV